MSVVIPVLDGASGLRLTLDALAAQEGAPPYEVIVVDNGSTDATPTVAETHPVGARLLHEPAPGPYAARNAGLAAARGRVVALTDADTHPWPRWLAEGVAAIDAGGDVVAGRIRQRATTGAPTVWERYDRGTYLRQDRLVAEQGFGATANLFVRADVVAAIGGFRPELTQSGDVEFGHRVRAKGYSLVYCAEAGVDHEPRTTMRDVWRLHRKLGRGFSELARAGLRERRPWRDPALRDSVTVAAERIAEDGPRVRIRVLLPVHAVVLAARWAGRLTGRG